MTALAAFWAFGSAYDGQARCESMLRAQQIYAASPGVCRSDGLVALGRRLHCLLPEDVHDTGPIVDARGRVLIADVRIDNRDELGRVLGLAGAARMSDAAILSEALLRWNDDAYDRIVGDFAFAQWDPARGTLLLARDFTGQRPLHYHAGDGFLAVASMPKGLHALPEIIRAPDADAAVDFLAHIPESGDASFYEGIAKVAPGHFAVLTRAGIASHRHWHAPTATLRLRHPDDYAQALREQLDHAVAARLRGATTNVATHLSGGLDSSAVTATAARITGGRVTAYTSVPRDGFVIPPDSPGIADEGPLAAAVAALYANVDHVRLSTNLRSPLDSLDRNVFLYERPYLNLCNGVWVDAINDDAKARGLTVLLVGAAGNASFSYHGMHRLGELARRGALHSLAREAVLLMRGGTAPRTVAAQAIGPFLPRAVWRGISTLRGRADDLTGYSAISEGAARDPGLAARAAARGVDFDYRPLADPRAAQLQLLGRVDVGNYNKGTLGGWGNRRPRSERRSEARRILPDRSGRPVSRERRAPGARAPRLWRPIAARRHERAPKGLAGRGLARGPDGCPCAAGRRVRAYRTQPCRRRYHRHPAPARDDQRLADWLLDASGRRRALPVGAAARSIDGQLHAQCRRDELTRGAAWAFVASSSTEPYVCTITLPRSAGLGV